MLKNVALFLSLQLMLASQAMHVHMPSSDHAYTCIHIHNINVYVPNDAIILSKETEEEPNICIGWDLNSVIFQKQIHTGSLIKKTLKRNGIKRTIKTAWKALKLFKKKRKLKKQNKNEGFIFDALITELERKDTQSARILREVTQEANSIDVSMLHVMQALTHQEYTHAVLSNMGANMLTAHIAKIRNEQKNYNAQDFDFLITFLTNETYNVISSEENGWMHKPEAPIYQLFKEKNSSKKPDAFFFIDDKEKNCIGAAQQGFVSFHYTSKATPADVHKAFEYMKQVLVQKGQAHKEALKKADDALTSEITVSA